MPHAPAKTSKRRRRWFRLLTCLLAVIASLGVCEIAVRILFGSPLPEKLPLMTVQGNRHRGYALVPNSYHYTYDYRVHVNNLGLRGDDIGDRQSGELRILALGDSLVYGQGVGDDQTVPFYLQQQLNQTAPDGTLFMVANGGVRGYSTNQELGMLVELGPMLQPDVVVLFWYWNDLQEHSIAEMNHRFTRLGHVAFDTEQTMRDTAGLKWTLRQVLRRSALLMWLHDTVRAWNAEPITDAEMEDGFQRLDGYLRQLAAQAAAHQFRLLMAIVPDPNSLRGPHMSDDANRRAVALAAEHGIATLELLEPARQADTSFRLPVIPYDGHYNRAANHAMAQAVAQWITESLSKSTPAPAW